LSDSNVLVIFYSRGGLTERLAVLLAEGAIQGGASIRLRRSRDVMPEDLIAADPKWQANRDRMHEEFAAPRIQDVEWADVVAFGTPAGPAGTGPELATTLAQIGLQVPAGILRGKGATAFTSSYGQIPGADSAIADVEGRLLKLGFVTLPRPQGLVEQGSALEYEAARVHGRLAASLGRTVRGWQQRPAL
jgi:NAD(P)H dehydrogenase (quinone)